MGGLFCGVASTSCRAMALNLGMLCSNTRAKDQLAKLGCTGAEQVFGACAVSAIVACVLSVPFDYFKTITQAGIQEPVNWWYFFGGFHVYYLRIAPHAMITL